MLNPPLWLTYDDVLLIPQYSEVESRDLVDLSIEFAGVKYSHPIIPSNMKDIATHEMYEALEPLGGMFIDHRFHDEEEYNSNEIDPKYFVSVGGWSIKTKDKINLFLDRGIKNFCIDLAHGHSKKCIDTIYYLKNCTPSYKQKPIVIAGNIATGSGAQDLFNAGADAVKCNVGPGSICTTRIMTGNGAPALSTLVEVRDYVGWNYDKIIIADGGIKNSGDIVKALCFADFVMIGNLLAGTDEADGYENGEYKTYQGSSTLKNKYIEGVKGKVKKTGSALNVINKLLQGIKSGLSYQGCKQLSEFHSLQPWRNFIQQTHNGFIESNPHDVQL